MKDVCIAWMRDNNKTALPSNDKFLKILTRDPKVDKDLFVWYWDQYLPKVAGTSKAWNKKIKYFGLISLHHPPDNPKNVYITPSTEAWAVLLIMNCRDRWPKQKELKEQNSARITYVKSATSTARAGATHVNITDHPDFVGKYTKADAGQKKFGGWSSDGLILYKELMEKNKDARKLPKSIALEKEILELLRKKHKIEGNNWEEFTQKKAGETTDILATEEVAGLFDPTQIDDVVAL
jgi:hypothetical protein